MWTAGMEELPPETLDLPSGPTHVRWRRNRRARRVTLRIDPLAGGVVLTLPMKASRKAGMDLLMGHMDWVADRLAQLPNAVTFTDGTMVPICGVPHRIRHQPDARGAAWILDEELHVTGAAEFISRRVSDFLR